MGIFFNRKKRFELQYGSSKPIEDTSLEDFLRYPIWLWDYANEGVGEQDETWIHPVVNSYDVTDDMQDAHILLRDTKNREWYVALLDVKKNQITDLFLMTKNVDIYINETMMKGLPKKKITLKAIPTINGESGVIFEVQVPANIYESTNLCSV